MKRMLILLSTVVTTASFALPSAYVKKSNISQVKPGSSESSLIADTEDPNKAWVLPPSAGKAELKSVEPTTNSLLCEGSKALLKGVSDLDKQRMVLSKEEVLSTAEAKRLNEIVMKRRDELAKLGDLPGIKPMMALTAQIRKIEKAIEDLYHKLEKVENQEEYDAILKRIDALEDEKKVSKERLWQLEDEYKESHEKLTKAQKRLDAAKENFKEANAYLHQILADISELSASALRIYKERATLIGATASVDYDSAWTKEVDRLRSTYSSLTFTKMPTYNARVHADFINLQNEETYYNMLPPLAAYNVNGKSGLAWGNREKQNSPDRGLTAFPEIVAADMYLNLVGACPAIDKEFFSEVTMNFKRSKDGVPVFAISTTYEYDVASAFEIKASYNLWKFSEKITRKTSRGGFFSRRSFVDVIESDLGKDSFDYEIINADDMPQEKQDAIVKQVKTELMSRVLNTIARPKMFSKIDAPHHELPPASGAIVLANGLSKVCGINVYCQVGGWILRVGDAVFGSTEAQSRFQKRWNYTASEHWKSTKLVPKQGRTTYRR